jgi:LPXTG-motif cell wall-anchored protein
MNHHVARPRRALVGVAAMTLGAGALVLSAFPSTASATGGPEHPCPDDGYYWHWGPRNQDEVPGEHTEDDANIESAPAEGDITFTISNVRDEGDGKAFDFTSSVPVVLVSVRGFQDPGHINEFDTPVISGTATGGDDYIKHVIVCPGEEEETTTSSSSSSSSTSEATTSTTEATTSTTEASTSTSEGPTSSIPSTTQGPTTTISSSGGLPVTGSNTTAVLAAVGAGLVLAGGALVATRRYWRRTA